ncbi:MAG: ATP-binding protein [Gemmatimonadetes bacterium]|nr:ATP-binding protein [Gemmatimonadota bacterium]
MKADSIYFKGHSCFKKDWAGFDTIKPINVIIGRNNSGKSHLLDLVEALCDGKLFDREWEYRFGGVLDGESLKGVFSESEWDSGNLAGNLWDDHGQYFVDKKITWEVIKNEVLNVDFPDGFNRSHDPDYSHLIPDKSVEARRSRIEAVLHNPTHRLNGTAFRRLFADRDIKTELPITKLALGPDGTGATNIIRRFITSENLPRDVIQEKLLAALNSIFGSDGQFSKIEVQVHDEAQTETIKDHWEVYLGEDTKGLIPLSKSGSGLKTVILVLLNLLAVPKIEGKDKSQFTFAIEELENNLHPALLRRLFKYLEDYAVNENATIFLTTHSSTALDFFGVSDNAQVIRVLHDGESAHTETVHTHSNLIKIVSELGARPSDLLQANGLIWVEGPSDRIYLNRWIELYTKDRPQGPLREGRDYQCVFYGGALLARVEFKSPEDEISELANLFQINHNLIVVCDGDREAEDSDLKPRVKRIREEVEKIDGAHIWITDAKEIENYLPSSVLEKVPDAVFKKATALSSLPDPGQYESWSSYIKENMEGTSIDKVALAISSAPHTKKEVMEERFDWKVQMEQIVERIKSWNGDSVST